MQQDMTIVEAVNRTTKPLDYMFDGIPGVLLPGYRINAKGVVLPAGRDGQPQTTHLTKVCAEYARRQNVKMGTEDQSSGEAELLIGIADRSPDGTLTVNPNWMYNDISYTEQSDRIERLDRSKMAVLDRNVTAMSASGMPKGRSASESPLNYNDVVATKA